MRSIFAFSSKAFTRLSAPKLVLALAVTTSFAGVACDTEPPPEEDGGVETTLFPAGYQDTYEEVRNCRANGGSHNFNQVRVMADPDAYDAYLERDGGFPVGAVVLKEEYESDDLDCAGDVVQWTVMQRVDNDDERLNWVWQTVDGERQVVNENEPRCYGCHAACVAPDGYESTCTVP